jgi:microsomal dipeptidase-like Zn-dependent dipeptidase
VARAVDAFGVDHVGFGTDNGGFGQSQAVWIDYADFPQIVELLRRKGFSGADIAKLVGWQLRPGVQPIGTRVGPLYNRP